MKFNTENHLKTIIDKLKSQGVEIGHLAHIEKELISTHQPWYSKISQTVKSNWSHVIGEISESKRMIHLLTNGVEGLSPTEKEEVKEQLSDLFRMIPAGLIATANAVLPLPGTSVFTPLLLHKAGLLPSRWREAHMLSTLQKEQTRLNQLGQSNLANEVAILQKEICTESDSRNQMCNLLQIWDDNKNGIWDPEEIEAYNSEVCLVNQHLKVDKPKRQWYILQDGFVFGPTHLPESFEDIEVLISFGGQTRWVRLKDAQANANFSVDEPPMIPVADEQIG